MQQEGGTPEEQRTAFEASAADRDRTLDALHSLEAALGTASPGRESDWLKQVAQDVHALEEAVRNEREESLRPDSLLSMIGRDYPRQLGSRIRQLREQHDDILRQLRSLREQVDVQASDDTPDVADLRQRLAWAIQAIRHRRAREADLVYEAVTLDLGRPAS